MKRIGYSTSRCEVVVTGTRVTRSLVHPDQYRTVVLIWDVSDFHGEDLYGENVRVEGTVPLVRLVPNRFRVGVSSRDKILYLSWDFPFPPIPVPGFVYKGFCESTTLNNILIYHYTPYLKPKFGRVYTK